MPGIIDFSTVVFIDLRTACYGSLFRCTAFSTAFTELDAHLHTRGYGKSVLLLEGQLEVSVDGRTYHLRPGDCLRYQLFGPSAFATPEQCSAKYILIIV